MPTRSMQAACAALALAATAALLSGCPRDEGGSAIQRQILQEIAALRDDVDEIKDVVEELQATPVAQTQAPAPAPRPTTSLMPVRTAGYPSLGRADAPVTIVEFSDYQCPFCRRHFASTVPQLKTDYIDTGKVRYVFVDNPLPSHPYADGAAQAAHCAGDQDHYWEMHDHLFENQHRITPDNLTTLAQEVGLDTKAFDACMKGGRHEAEVEAGRRLAAGAGAHGTPGFVIGKTTPDGTVSGELIVGAKAFSLFKDRLETLLAN
jgi:protein-disulfide isomerase